MLSVVFYYPPEVRRGRYLGVGSIPVAIVPSSQYMKLLHHNCLDIHIVG